MDSKLEGWRRRRHFGQRVVGGAFLGGISSCLVFANGSSAAPMFFVELLLDSECDYHRRHERVFAWLVGGSKTMRTVERA
jgi:hypothetical protein